MPTVITQGAASAKGYGFGASSTAANYIEDVFSTYLYTGNSTSGGTQTITNSIDLSTKGGMVWIKGRSAASDNVLFDTARGAGTTASDNQAIFSNLSTAQNFGASYDFLSAFNADGFTVKQGGTTTATRGTNYNAVTYASWTFRKQAKFFDVVTYTGNGVAGRAISHNLGTTPGCIIIKCTSNDINWVVYHRSRGNLQYLTLNSTAAEGYSSSVWNSTDPTSTTFTVGNNSLVNTSGRTYVAYLFAHDAGGFGAAGTDNVISCGSFTTDGSGIASATLGYEPQWVLIRSTGNDDWWMVDNMRGFFASPSTSTAYFSADTLTEERAWGSVMQPTATGFTTSSLAASTAFIYIAIRRGPMKTPTSGTSVFSPVAYSGNATVTNRTTGFPVDAVFISDRTPGSGDTYPSLMDRIRAVNGLRLVTSSNAGNETASNNYLKIDLSDGFQTQATASGYYFNDASATYIAECFRRAPGFFDIVAYTGTGSNTTKTHNLGAAPQLLIVKRTDTSGGWATYSSSLANTEYLLLANSDAKATGTTVWNSTSPTSTVFSIGTDTRVNASGGTYVSYLFGTVAGVSKVGSYTGTGTTKQIDCGFTGGARFVLIKRTDSTGDWYYWDSARGIVAGNDPYLLLNSTAAEVTSTDYIDTYSAGFEISSTAPAAINANGGTFIFLAIA